MRYGWCCLWKFDTGNALSLYVILNYRSSGIDDTVVRQKILVRQRASWRSRLLHGDLLRASGILFPLALWLESPTLSLVGGQRIPGNIPRIFRLSPKNPRVPRQLRHSYSSLSKSGKRPVVQDNHQWWYQSTVPVSNISYGLTLKWTWTNRMQSPGPTVFPWKTPGCRLLNLLSCQFLHCQSIPFCVCPD